MAELLKRSQFGPALALADHADPMIDDADAKLLKPSMVPTRRLMIGQKFAQMTLKDRPNDLCDADDVDGQKFLTERHKVWQSPSDLPCLETSDSMMRDAFSKLYERRVIRWVKTIRMRGPMSQATLGDGKELFGLHSRNQVRTSYDQPCLRTRPKLLAC